MQTAKEQVRKLLRGLQQIKRQAAAHLLGYLTASNSTPMSPSGLLWLLAYSVYFIKRLVQHLAMARFFRGRDDFRFWKREIDTSFLMKLVAWSAPPVNPHHAYDEYVQNNRLTAAEEQWMRAQAPRLAYRPLISILVPVYNSEPCWLERLVRSVRAQTYDRWELILVDDASPRSDTQSALAAIAESDERIVWDRLDHNQGISAATNHAAELANGEFLAFVDHDDELLPETLWWVVDHLQKDPAADLIYTDEEYAPDNEQQRYPFFKPAFSPELLTAYNYMCHLLVVRRRIFEEVGRLRPETDGAQDYDLILRIIEKTQRVAHIPRVLYRWHLVPQSVSRERDPKTQECRQSDRIYAVMQRVVQEHLDRTGLPAEAEVVRQWIRPRFADDDRGKVSIILCTKDHPLYLWRAVRSIEKLTRYPNYEIVIVDNGNSNWLSKMLLQRLARRHRVLPIASGPEGFNYAYLNNQAARQVDGEYLLFLNDDTRVMTADWLNAMVGYATRQEVGAVGARLLFPNRTLQHAGLILGAMGWGPWHALRGCVADTDEAFGYMTFPHNCIAVTGACLLTRRELFWRFGGFDEKRFAVAFNDVDYCLRLYLAGYRCVVAPQAELIHYESVSRCKVLDPKEAVNLASRYRGLTDPYWNRNCSRSSAHLALSSVRQRKELKDSRLPSVLWVGKGARTDDGLPNWQYLAENLRVRESASIRCVELNKPFEIRDLQKADVVVADGADAVGVVELASKHAVPCIWHLPERLLLRPNHQREDRKRLVRVLSALTLPYRIVFNNLYSLQWLAGAGATVKFDCLENVFVRPDSPSLPCRAQLRSEFGLSDDDVFVLGGGRLDRPEEVEFLLAVATRALKQRPFLNFALMLNGANEHHLVESLRKRVRRLGSGAQLILNPNIEARQRAYQMADVFLGHSLADPRCGFVLHAMQAELPILGPLEVAQADLIHPNANGDVFRRFSVSQAVEGLLRLADVPQRRQVYGANSRFWLRSRSSPQDVLRQWESLILGAAELLEGNAIPQPAPATADFGEAKVDADAIAVYPAAVDVEARIA